MKKYILCIVDLGNGQTLHNPLKLSEAHLISKWIQDGYTVTCMPAQTDKDGYKRIFG